MAGASAAEQLPREAVTLRLGLGAGTRPSWSTARAVGWLVIGVLVAITIIRLWQPDDSMVVVGIAALTPYWYVIAWPVAVLAIVRRRWLLGAAAVVMIAVQVAIVLPTWHPWVTAAPAAGGWRLRLFDANVRFNNPDLSGIAAQIASDHPDVVTLEELSTGNVGSLEATGVMQRYHYHLIAPDPGTLGIAVWSDVPMGDLRVWHAGSHPEIEGVLHPAVGPAITFLVVHTFAPVGTGQPATWDSELTQISARVAATPGQLVIAGDLNATDDMHQLRALRQHQLDDSAVERGRGWQMTWPANYRLLPALVRPDHVLYTSGLTATSYRLGHPDGSDHRPLLVTLARTQPG